MPVNSAPLPVPAASHLDIIDDTARAAVLLDSTRLRILQELAEPSSAAGVARRLSLPRQKVNYHLRELEKAGVVEGVEERRKGGCVERIVRATASSYLVGPAALGALGADPARIRDRFSAAYLVAVAARAIRELAMLGRWAAKAGMRLSTFTLETEVRFASPADRKAFAEELANAVAALTAKYHREDAPAGRVFRFFAGAYPAITKTESEAGPALPTDRGPS